MSHRPLVPPLRGFARGAEIAEENVFPFSAERAEKGKT